MVMPLNGPLSLDAPKKLKITELGTKPPKKPKITELETKPPKNKKQKGGYTVQAGDNYFTIAEKLFGNQRYAGLLISANGGMLRPGDVISVPDVDGGDPNVYFSQGAYKRGLELMQGLPSASRYGGSGGQTQTTSQVTLTNPPTVSSVGVNNYSALAAQTPTTPGSSTPAYTGYIPAGQGGGYVPTAPFRPGMANPSSRTTRPPRPPQPTYPSSGAKTPAQPPLQGQDITKPGAATGYYTGVGMPSYYQPSGPYDPYNPAYVQNPPTMNAAGNFTQNVPGNQQVNVTQGMTGAQTALALESGIANKPAGTYQVQGTVQRPIYSATEVDVYGRPKIVGWETVPTGTVNVGATGTKPAAYVGWTDPMNKPGGQKIIGGGEGYPDYIPAGPPRPPGTPVYPGGQMGGGGGGGGGRRGGGGGGPTGGGGRGAPARYTPPAVFAQANSLPGGYRNPARDVAGLSRTGLVTWRL